MEKDVIRVKYFSIKGWSLLIIAFSLGMMIGMLIVLSIWRFT